VLTAVTYVSEVIVIFLQLILFANRAAFFFSLFGFSGAASPKIWGAKKFWGEQNV